MNSHTNPTTNPAPNLTTNPTKPKTFTGFLKDLTELITKKNPEDGAKFKEWYINWMNKTACWRAPELKHMNIEDIEDRLSMLCGQKDYYNEVKVYFNQNKP